jgi:hypothetical protein
MATKKQPSAKKTTSKIKTKADPHESLAFVKYEGELVKDGYMDAKKSADALLGFDEVVRYF